VFHSPSSVTEEVSDVGISASAGFVDDALWRTVEPGTLSPGRRITRYVHELAAEFGIGPSHPGAARRLPARKERRSPLDQPGPTQLTLL
jgi:hypothetical protein